jgi:hypothetical protein
MAFYALRVVCQSCGSAFLVGGSTASDLAQWRSLTVECRNCSAETPALGGETVDLRPAPSLGGSVPRAH